MFPEQAVNWAWYARKIRAAGRPVKVLNLFGYTGGATLACAAAGATVCHVDASKGIVAWGKDNAVASGLADRPIRWLVDDCAKFVAREKRRGNTYDGIIDRDVSLMSLKRMDVDALGLDELDRSLLRAIIEMYNGGPVGLETLAAALGEEAVTLEDLCEPYLMQMGFLTRTPRGRCATRLAYEHLGLKAPETGSPEDNGQQSLF